MLVLLTSQILVRVLQISWLSFSWRAIELNEIKSRAPKYIGSDEGSRKQNGFSEELQKLLILGRDHQNINALKSTPKIY